MLQFVWQKICNKKWLILSLLIGNLLLVAIAAASPMYTKAALQRMLTRTMSDYTVENNSFPTTLAFYSSAANDHALLEEDAAYINSLEELLGVKPTSVVYNRYLSGISLEPGLVRGDKRKVKASVANMAELADHAQIVSGSLYGDTADKDGVFDAIISESCMLKQGLIQGEVLAAPELTANDGQPLRLRIAGVFQIDPEDREYWNRPSSYYESMIFLSDQAFAAAIPQETLNEDERSTWDWTFDYRDLTVNNYRHIAAVSEGIKEAFSEDNRHSYLENFTPLIAQYEVEAKRVRSTLLILQVPIYVLLAAFIFMVSRQMLELEAAEIAVIKSRGASSRQIIGIYLLQSALLSGASLVLGIPLAMLICQIIGSSNAFLEFVSRTSLQVQITGEVLLYALIAALLSITAMVLPVLRYSRTTIVAARQSKAKRNSRAQLWKLLFSLLLIGGSLYCLYNFQGQAEQITQKVQEGAGLDPLLYLSSSLFIVGCGLLALCVIPLVVRLIYHIGRSRWSPPLYASYLWVMRSKGGGFIMTFLVVTIALGIFSASVARTVNSNETDRITYTDGGADVVLMEKWKSSGTPAIQQAQQSAMSTGEDQGGSSSGKSQTVYQEPDFMKYQGIPGVESATRVLWDDGAGIKTTGGAGVKDYTATLVGIHTKEFGETARLKEGLLPLHFYEYLNAISQNSDALLVSSNARDKLGLKLGSALSFQDSDGRTATGTIYGFVDYWPGYLAASTVGSSLDAATRQVDNLLVVANLSFLQMQWGVTPYQVWLRMENGSTAPVYDFVMQQENLTLTLFRDQSADLIAMKNDPGIQGTNGILTVGFVVALALCTVGFLIYWILAIRSRSLQFGVFRAMGMSMKEIVIMLANEQFYVSGLSIAMGAGTGVLASRLFVPLIQLAYVRAETPLPLEVSLAGSDVLRLLIVVLLVMAVCMVILGAIIRRMKIDQALKLGED